MNKSRYNLRSSINNMGTIASRTRSRSNDVVLDEKIVPTRKRVRVKTEPLTPGVVVKVEQDCSSSSSSVVSAIAISKPVRVKVEPSSSNSTPVVPKVEFHPSPSPSSSTSSSPISLKAERPASPALSNMSLQSSSSPPPPYNTINSNVHGGNFTSINNAPSGSKVKVWDVQNGQHVIRELPLVASEQPRHEQRELVSSYQERPKPYYKKPYYKKPYRPYWKRNNRGGGRGGWQCRCNGACSNCGAVTTYQTNGKPMNLHCNIVINAPSTRHSSSAYIEELTDEDEEEEEEEEEVAPSYRNKSRSKNAVALPNKANAPPVPVFVPQPAYYYHPQPYYYPQPQISYNYMWYNVSCATRFY